MFAALLLALLPIGWRLPFLGGALSEASNSVALCLLSLLLVAGVVVWLERYLGLHARLRSFISTAARPTDTSFLLFAVVVLLIFILTFEGYTAVNWAFLALISATPASRCFSSCHCLRSSRSICRSFGRGELIRAMWSRLQHGGPTSAAVLAALGALSLHGSLLDHLVPASLFKAVYESPLLPLALVKLAITGVFSLQCSACLLWPGVRVVLDLRQVAIVSDRRVRCSGEYRLCAPQDRGPTNLDIPCGLLQLPQRTAVRAPAAIVTTLG